MLDLSLELQQRYENSTSAEYRKERGQVFTPPEVARYMATLLSPRSTEYRLLDPGAGIGSLTAVVCERFLHLRSSRHITAHLFENDRRIIPLLHRNLENCQRVLSEAGHRFDYIVHDEDFVLAASSGLDGQKTFDSPTPATRFDAVIMNPPYFKVRKDSVYARRMASIVHGQPNIYAFFMALAAGLLKEDGELVAITPRSFCNGPYFRAFRQWLFQRVALDHIHVFESRADTFQQSSVLQESIITKVHRLGRQAHTITITSSFGRDLDGPLARSEARPDDIIDNSHGDAVIRIPGGSDDRRVMELVESLPTRFADVGLRISTGPVVLFRATEFLLDNGGRNGSVPLLMPHNVKRFETVWPVKKNGKPVAIKLCRDSMRLLRPTQNYVLLKRFTAKEERRRLVAGCFLRAAERASHVGIENHVNFVYHGERELSDDETFGVAAIFNSRLFDRYFRVISGTTQVNATEIRSMNFPDLKTVATIGRRTKTDASRADLIVAEELGMRTLLPKHLLERQGEQS
jgi:adenine-specific DNA-methyltransferase